MNKSTSHPNTSKQQATSEEKILRLLAWEVTRSCPLKCTHCRASAENRRYSGELDTDECFKVLDSLAALGSPIVILTGGEPMSRSDIYEIASYGTNLGLRMVMAPCGMMIDDETSQKLIDSGIRRISLSIDGADADTHDKFRGVLGAFDSVIAATKIAQRVGLEFQINTTVTKLNVGQLGAIHDLAVEIGAVGFHPFLLVPTGRGKELAELEIDPNEYEQVLHWLYERSRSSPIQFKPTCAPHYYRVLREREHAEGRKVSPKTHGLDAMTRGCLGGQGFAFLSHIGIAQMCGFLDEPAGDIRNVGYDFGVIWRKSELFLQMRNVKHYAGKCGICRYHRVCGGCRARAFAETGDYMAEEPYCIYEPAG